MCKFLNAMMSAWHHGKGGKYTRTGKHSDALRHFQLALVHARKAGEKVTIAIEVECIARTYLRLAEYDKAKKNANISINLYKKIVSGPVITAAIQRTNDLLIFLKAKKD